MLKEEIFEAAKGIGFDLVGCSKPRVEDGSRYRDWLDRQYAGSMEYLHRHLDKRTDPVKLVPDVRTILCVGLNYHQGAPEPREPTGRVGLYAWGGDYHEIVKAMLDQLADRIGSIVGGDPVCRSFVDTGPVMEKALGRQAGLGWIGKNGCLINERIGSFFFLGELFLNVELPPDQPVENRCGDCGLCIEACPTGAIVEPGLIDTRRCISYLTIEHRDEFTSEQARSIGDCVFGCDRCQRVCPFNHNPPETSVSAFRRWALGPYLRPDEILNWTEDDFLLRTAHSAGRRAKLIHWRRNASAVAENLRNTPLL